MNKCHVCQDLENAIGKTVKIRFFDNEIKTGILKHSEYGRGYSLIHSEGILGFYKTHIKNIEVLN